jgi:hypothetical protein
VKGIEPADMNVIVPRRERHIKMSVADVDVTSTHHVSGQELQEAHA